jgi:hypothetical protein
VCLSKKTHEWMVDQIADLFLTTHRVQTQHVIKSRGHHCRDIELTGYLVNETGPVPLVLDPRIAHDRFGSSSDPSLNGNLHYPNNIDESLIESADDKIRKYRADYNNNPPHSVSFTPTIASSSVRLHSNLTDELTIVVTSQTVRHIFAQQFKSRVGLTLTKAYYQA